MAARLRRRQRLRTRAEFDRVFRRGRRLDGRLFTLILVPNELDVDRLGLAVSRRAGDAVTRNRMKRLLREAFRHLDRGGGRGLDFVVLAKRELACQPLDEVRREWSDRLQRARASRAGGRPASAAG